MHLNPAATTAGATPPPSLQLDELVHALLVIDAILTLSDSIKMKTTYQLCTTVLGLNLLPKLLNVSSLFAIDTVA